MERGFFMYQIPPVADHESLIKLTNNCIITERILLHKRTPDKIKYCITI
jgi:hypothetical protein